MKTTDYTTQAETFLSRNGIKFRATLSNTKRPQWDGPSGHHYRIALSRRDGSPRRITFDFWGSQNDMMAGRGIRAYDVLACISSDAFCPDTFEDFCAEYGYDEDSISARRTFLRCSRFAKRLREFFTSSELEELSEIR